MENPTICLNMIVKDEADIIINTLSNIVEKIKIDYWVICDTGSTDNTIELIKNFFEEKKNRRRIDRRPLARFCT